MMNDDRVKQKLDKKRQIEELRKKNKAEYEKVKNAVRLACKDQNVRVILRHMAKICGFFTSNIVVNPNTSEINALSTLHNESRRTVYLDLRRMMSDADRKAVESKDD